MSKERPTSRVTPSTDGGRSASKKHGFIPTYYNTTVITADVAHEMDSALRLLIQGLHYKAWDEQEAKEKAQHTASIERKGRKAAEIQAHEDELTRVSNPRGLKREMARLVSEQQREDRRVKEKSDKVTIVFIDANDFGLINKILGDQAGDCAIKTIAEYLSEPDLASGRPRVRSNDASGRTGWKRNYAEEDKKTFTGRKGGDEFVLLMRCPKKEAERKLRLFQKEFPIIATAIFKEKCAKLFPEEEDLEKKLDELQEAIAEKYENPNLLTHSFRLSFSFGARELLEKDIKGKDKDDITTVITALLGEGDKWMRENKAKYRLEQAARGPSGASQER
ncbi:MAG: diguanylate cyclase [Alphaproteobacteria bacterium]|nr:diguanylate cyclase [Alphaproteobacteria bacterium]